MLILSTGSMPAYWEKEGKEVQSRGHRGMPGEVGAGRVSTARGPRGSPGPGPPADSGVLPPPPASGTRPSRAGSPRCRPRGSPSTPRALTLPSSFVLLLLSSKALE